MDGVFTILIFRIILLCRISLVAGYKFIEFCANYLSPFAGCNLYSLTALQFITSIRVYPSLTFQVMIDTGLYHQYSNEAFKIESIVEM